MVQTVCGNHGVAPPPVKSGYLAQNEGWKDGGIDMEMWSLMRLSRPASPPSCPPQISA